MLPTSPESLLLRHIAAIDITNRREMLRALYGVVDWDQTLNAATTHNLASLAYLQLKDEPIDAEIKSRLRKAHRGALARGLQFAAELHHLTDLLDRHGIAFAAYKGPVAAIDLYGDLGAREMSDVDILVAPLDRDRAIDLLRADGYRDPLALTPRQERAWYRFSRERPLLRERVNVDFHWGISNDQFPLRIDVAAMLQRGVRREIDGRAVPTFADEDMAIVLAGHGTRHLWERLEWLSGFAVLLRRPLDWNSVMQRARAAHAARQLQFAAHLAAELLGVDVPEALRGDRRRFDKPIALVRSQLFAGSNEKLDPWKKLTTIGPLFDRRRDAASSTLESIFSPRISDWQAVPLPTPLHPLYWIIRPIRLLLRQ